MDANDYNPYADSNGLVYGDEGFSGSDWDDDNDSEEGLIAPCVLNGVELSSMTAVVTVESGMFQILGSSNVGLGHCGIKEGSNTYAFLDALSIIRKIDSILQGVPKCYQKKIRATRMQFMFAFGPEMESFLREPVNAD